ncbi:MAG: alpha/beta hydrolase [Pseudomonadota bacterium]
MTAPLFPTETTSLPEGTTASWFESHDGARLRLAHFGGSGARGTALIVPGWTEPVEKYGETALDLQDRGFAVVAYDPRGQGLSDRHTDGDDRARIDDFSKHIGDLNAVVASLAAERLTVVGHSMGGLITLSWLAGGGAADAAVLSAPATRIFRNVAQRVATRGLAWVMCRAGLRDQAVGGEGAAMTFEGNNLTSDPERHKVMRDLALSDPKMALPKPTPAFVAAMDRQQVVLHGRDAFAQLSVPTMIVSAGNDTVVDPTDHELIARSSPHIDVVHVPGAEHELLMERDELRDQFWDAFDAHIARHLPGLSADLT